MIVLRRTRPDLERGFRVPFVPVFPIIGAVLAFYLMKYLERATWIRFGVWLVIGLVIYFAYGIRHSRLRRGRGREPRGAGLGEAALQLVVRAGRVDAQRRRDVVLILAGEQALERGAEDEPVRPRERARHHRGDEVVWAQPASSAIAGVSAAVSRSQPRNSRSRSACSPSPAAGR